MQIKRSARLERLAQPLIRFAKHLAQLARKDAPKRYGAAKR